MADQPLTLLQQAPDRATVRSAIRRHVNCHGPHRIEDCKDAACQAAALALDPVKRDG